MVERTNRIVTNFIAAVLTAALVAGAAAAQQKEHKHWDREPEMKIDPNKVYVAGDTALFILSPDPSAFRNNVGVRTLDDGASMTVMLRNSSGAVVKAITKSYMPNFFQQTSLDAFLEGVTLVGNEVLQIQIASGGGIIYVSTVDDVTQDPSVYVGP